MSLFFFQSVSHYEYNAYGCKNCMVSRASTTVGCLVGGGRGAGRAFTTTVGVDELDILAWPKVQHGGWATQWKYSENNDLPVTNRCWGGALRMPYTFKLVVGGIIMIIKTFCIEQTRRYGEL